MSQNPPRSRLLQAAALPEPTLLQRLARLQFRRPPQTGAIAAQAAGDERTFTPTDEGSGAFGRWTLDEAGLPAYQYEMDQYADPRAHYENSENLDRRDHWHQIGNYRVTGLASNDGVVQVYLCDRGGVFLNRFEAQAQERQGNGLLLLLIQILQAALVFIMRLVTPRAAPTIPGSLAAQAAGTKPRLHPRETPPVDVIRKLGGEAGADVQAQAQTAQPSTVVRDKLETRYAFAGGFSYLYDGTESWATAYRYRPAGSNPRRVFGMGYFETEMTHRNIRVRRRAYAPDGDLPALLADVEIENVGSEPVSLQHYEYWDVNVQQLRLEWIRGGDFGVASDETRCKLNQYFQSAIRYDESSAALVFEQILNDPPPPHARPADQPSEVDWYPAPVFLRDLSGTPDAYYMDKARFFGTGGASRADTPRQGGQQAASPTERPELMPYCMVMRRDFTLQPGEKKALRYAYGRGDAAEQARLAAYRSGAPFAVMQGWWKDHLGYFQTGADPVLHREMAWHSYNMLSSVVRSAYHGVNVVPQGSAYLYLHGTDGVPRDQALFTIPATYFDTELARDLLRLIMRITDGQSGQIPYSFTGHGATSTGLGVHASPSDLDIFFLLGMAEYLSATGDMAFLDEVVPYYPPGKQHIAAGDTVLDHIRLALKHLLDSVGTGDNGLIRVGSGDWSDSIVLEMALQDGPFGVAYFNSKAHGESVSNTQMALYVLPLLAAILKDRAPDIVTTIDSKLAGLKQAVERQWNANGWYNRAILRDPLNQQIVIDRLDLEAQPWAIISGAAREAGHEETLIERIDKLLDTPSPIGAELILGERGMVWPAVTQLLTWAYVRAGRHDLAWRSLNRHTFAVHATEYPAVWFNIWSGPDGINGVMGDPMGGTWDSPLTPMTDFPAMNNNQHAMSLLGLLRVCGVEPAPSGDGLTIRPESVPSQTWVLDTPLLRLEVDGGRIRGEYRAQTSGQITLYLHPPGQIMASTVPLTFNAGDRVGFEA